MLSPFIPRLDSEIFRKVKLFIEANRVGCRSKTWTWNPQTWDQVPDLPLSSSVISSNYLL